MTLPDGSLKGGVSIGGRKRLIFGWGSLGKLLFHLIGRKGLGGGNRARFDRLIPTDVGEYGFGHNGTFGVVPTGMRRMLRWGVVKVFLSYGIMLY